MAPHGAKISQKVSDGQVEAENQAETVSVCKR